MTPPINRDRAERIARGLHCSHCLEYSFKRLIVKPASKANEQALNEAWHVSRQCGICGHEEELGLDPEGDVLYMS